MSKKSNLSLYLLKSGTYPAMAMPSLAEAMIGTVHMNNDVSVRAWLVGDDAIQALPTLPERMPPAPVLVIRAVRPADSWLAMLMGIIPVMELERVDLNYGALLFQPVGSDSVLWSFGHAWSLIDMRRTVERFGLKAGLNALLTSAAPAGEKPRDVGVRGLTSAIRATVVRQSTVLAARPSKPSALERVDQSSDAAAMAELTTHHPIFDRIVAGKSLRFQAPVVAISCVCQAPTSQ